MEPHATLFSEAALAFACHLLTLQLDVLSHPSLSCEITAVGSCVYMVPSLCYFQRRQQRRQKPEQRRQLAAQEGLLHQPEPRWVSRHHQGNGRSRKSCRLALSKGLGTSWPRFLLSCADEIRLRLQPRGEGGLRTCPMAGVYHTCSSIPICVPHPATGGLDYLFGRVLEEKRTWWSHVVGVLSVSWHHYLADVSRVLRYLATNRLGRFDRFSSCFFLGDRGRRYRCRAFRSTGKEE